MNSAPFLSSSDVSVRNVSLPGKLLAVSVDLEADYGSDTFDGLNALDTLLDIFRQRRIAATFFVEGRILRKFPGIAPDLAAAGHDVQLHCDDHSRGNDDRPALERGIQAYRHSLGVAPRGYRAHTYQLTLPLFRALKELGFDWDSSLLPGRFGVCANTDPAWNDLENRVLLFDEAIVEIPLSRFRRLPLPLGQSYRMLLRRLMPMESLRAFGVPDLCAFNMHMADLVRLTPALKRTKLPSLVKGLYTFMWSGNRQQAFHLLCSALDYLLEREYAPTTTSALALDARERFHA